MPAVKRSAPESSVSRRRSGRLSSTPKKSTYFEDSDTEGDEDGPPPKKRGRPAKRSAPVDSESEDKYEEENEDDDDDDDDDDEDDDEDKVPAKAKEEESEEDDDAPRQVKILPLEQMRGDGGVDYEDQKIHKNTLLFLKDLKANNRRPWLKSHDKEYRRAVKDWESFVEAATQSLVDVDETVPELPVKDVIFRIHRDIRFTKDPTPYKPHFSAAWSRTGRKGPYACYYVHCEPGSSFVGGGLWCPDSAHLANLRRSIDRHPDRWRRALGEPVFRRVFFPGVKASAGVEGVVTAFVAKNQGNALKKRPMNYEASHRDIELLKLRNYTVGTKIDEGKLCGEDAQRTVSDAFQGLFGFVTFLNSIVMPDPNIAQDDDDDE